MVVKSETRFQFVQKSMTVYIKKLYACLKEAHEMALTLEILRSE